MSLDTSIKQQLQQYLALLEAPVVVHYDSGLGADSSARQQEDAAKVREFVAEIVAMSDKLSLVESKLEIAPAFSLYRGEENLGVIFAGVPLGHEFTSFVLALLQVSGRAPKISAELVQQIKSINKPLHFQTFVSLSCHNCPEVVQALNIMSVLNPLISHTMIEGSMFQSLADEKGILAVPAVFLDGAEFSNGRSNLEEILSKIGAEKDNSYLTELPVFDVLVVGGGPAAASAAIYAARKGIETGLVAQEFGGQVKTTLGIENIIGTPYTEGPKFMDQVKEHILKYPVRLIENEEVTALNQKDGLTEISLASGYVLKAKTVILALGAKWRDINVPGEQEYKAKGIAYCPHCDGPLFKGKKLAVVGGGNSGIEAAIDLANIVEHVTVLEFLPELKADMVLQKRLYSLPNVDVKTNVQTTEITGDKTVNGIKYRDRNTNEETHLPVSGVFIQIGLLPNTAWLKGVVELNQRGEIIVDAKGATNLPGVFAAGDCTNSAYKQIIISMGSGATAALGAFDYLMRN